MDCKAYNQETKEFIAFWIEGVATELVIVIGLATNITSAIILRRKNMRHVFNTMLIALAAVDIGFLTSMGFGMSLHNGLGVESRTQVLLMPHVIYPMTAIFMTASVYMMVAISIERYRTLYYPVKSLSDKKKLGLYIACALGLAFIIQMPRFFELSTDESDGVLVLLARPHRLHSTYVLVYVTWIQIIATFVIPMIALVFFNFKIYRKVIQENGFRRANPNAEAECLEDKENRVQETKLAIVLMSISFVMLVCHLPRGIANIYEALLLHVPSFCHKADLWVEVMINVSHLLLAINSSVNILFFVMFNQKFSDHFFQMFWCFRTTARQEVPDRPELSVLYETGVSNILIDSKTIP